MESSVIAEHFQVIAQLSACVWKVRRKVDGKLMVWEAFSYKSMNQLQKQSVIHHMDCMSHLRHLRLIGYHNRLVDQDKCILYLLQDWCPGGDMKTLVHLCRRRGWHLSEGLIWRVLRQLCEGLQVILDSHSYCSNALSLDIRPSSVYLDEDGNIKLDHLKVLHTLGENKTNAYMSPEVICGGAEDEKSWLWSCACVLYELCALTPPFSGNSSMRLRQSIIQGRFVRIPRWYSNELQAMLSWLLSIEPQLRPSVHMILHHPSLMSCVRSLQMDMSMMIHESQRPSLPRQFLTLDDMISVTVNGSDRSELQSICTKQQPSLTEPVCNDKNTFIGANKLEPSAEISEICDGKILHEFSTKQPEGKSNLQTETSLQVVSTNDAVFEARRKNELSVQTEAVSVNDSTVKYNTECILQLKPTAEHAAETKSRIEPSNKNILQGDSKKKPVQSNECRSEAVLVCKPFPPTDSRSKHVFQEAGKKASLKKSFLSGESERNDVPQSHVLKTKSSHSYDDCKRLETISEKWYQDTTDPNIDTTFSEESSDTESTSFALKCASNVELSIYSAEIIYSEFDDTFFTSGEEDYKDYFEDPYKLPSLMDFTSSERDLCRRKTGDLLSTSTPKKEKTDFSCAQVQTSPFQQLDACIQTSPGLLKHSAEVAKDTRLVLREKLDALNLREDTLNNRELQMSRRERKVNLMEKIAKEKLTRAQVYLKQCKERHTVNLQDIPGSSVSGDIGDASTARVQSRSSSDGTKLSQHPKPLPPIPDNDGNFEELRSYLKQTLPGRQAPPGSMSWQEQRALWLEKKRDDFFKNYKPEPPVRTTSIRNQDEKENNVHRGEAVKLRSKKHEDHRVKRRSMHSIKGKTMLNFGGV